MKIDISGISKDLKKLKSKDSVLFTRVQKKIKQIAAADVFIDHLKNLRHDLSDFKRVQVGSFVLFFRHEQDTIIFCKFKHHDDAYRR